MIGLPPSPRLPAVLKRISDQLDHLADETHQIEHALGEEIGGGSAPGADNIMRLQRLDFLRQSLEDLALLTLFVSQASDGHARSDWHARLRLDATRALLEPEMPSSGLRPDGTSSGEVDLF